MSVMSELRVQSLQWGYMEGKLESIGRPVWSIWISSVLRLGHSWVKLDRQRIVKKAGLFAPLMTHGPCIHVSSLKTFKFGQAVAINCTSSTSTQATGRESDTSSIILYPKMCGSALWHNVVATTRFLLKIGMSTIQC
jgi:hypothetical protein